MAAAEENMSIGRTGRPRMASRPVLLSASIALMAGCAGTETGRIEEVRGSAWQPDHPQETVVEVRPLPHSSVIYQDLAEWQQEKGDRNVIRIYEFTLTSEGEVSRLRKRQRVPDVPWPVGWVTEVDFVYSRGDLGQYRIHLGLRGKRDVDLGLFDPELRERKIWVVPGSSWIPEEPPQGSPIMSVVAIEDVPAF